jgi:hypothetical protein
MIAFAHAEILLKIKTQEYMIDQLLKLFILN